MNFRELEAADEVLTTLCIEEGILMVRDQGVHKLLSAVTDSEEGRLDLDWFSMYLGCPCPKPERIEVSQLVSIYWRLYINPIEKEEQQILEVIERAGGVGLIFNDEPKPLSSCKV